MSWSDQRKDLSTAMAAMGHRQFVVVQYVVGLDPNPYAQAAPELDGTWYCEVVSTHFLPEEVWPIDQYYLWQHDWEAPEAPGENWARSARSSDEAAALLISAISRGRLCLDPTRLVCEVGRWSDGPDGGGEPLPFPVEPYLLAA